MTDGGIRIKTNMTNKNIILIIVATCIVWCIAMYFIIQDSTVCDTVVVMHDGWHYECSDVYTNYGMATISFCNGTSIRVPISDIKIIRQQ